MVGLKTLDTVTFGTVFVLLTVICKVGAQQPDDVWSRQNTTQMVFNLKGTPLSLTTSNATLEVDTIEELRTKFQLAVSTILRQIIPYVMRFDYTSDTNPVCTGSIVTFVMALNRLEGWAFHMMDSTGKIPAGMLRGTLVSLGDYDQCLKTIAGFPDAHENEKNFRGQYCSVDIIFIMPESKPEVKYANFQNLLRRARWHFGVCVPSTCTPEDLTNFVSSAAGKMRLELKFNWCEVAENGITLKIEHYISAGFILAIMLVVMMGTVAHYVHKKRFSINDVKDKKPSRLVLSLSLIHNGEKLLYAKFKEARITCLNGIRFLTMCWIICTQAFYYGRDVHVGQTMTMLEEARTFLGQTFANSQPAVDTFFVISGMLVVYLGLRRLQQTGGKLKLPNYYLHRFFRLTPAFMMTTAVVILLPLFGSGPMWKEYLSGWANNCVRNWWTNLLYIGTFYNRVDMCLPYTWFLSVDMLFYIASPLIILLFYRHEYVALVLIPILMAFSMMITGLVTYYYNIPPIPLVDQQAFREEEYLNYLQSKPYPHIAPYCVGIILGYVLQKKKTLPMNKIFLVTGWFLSFCSLFAIVYGPYNWNRGRTPSIEESVVFAVFNKTGWSIGIAWVILVCATGNGGWVNTFLSWSGFTLVGRLTYCSFLLHSVIIMVYNATSRSMEPYRTIHFLLISLGSLLATFTLSFFVSLFFESPFVGIEKVKVAAPLVNMYRRRKSSILRLDEMLRRHSLRPGSESANDSISVKNERRLSVINKPQELTNIAEEQAKNEPS